MIIHGNIFEDSRGKIRLFNSFDMRPVVRMYCIEPQINTIRAWQGHKNENKWFFVSRGSFLVKLVNMLSGDRKEFLLIGNKSEILHIPSGFYNGFKPLEEGSILIVFSDLTLEQSKSDDFRITIDKLPW